MTSPTLSVTAKRSESLRPFNAYRDLERVADLIELCFADTLDPDGRRYLQQMRSAARSIPRLPISAPLVERSGMPYSGFIWEEDSAVVGNLTLIPNLSKSQKLYLIANVSVHPDYRRRGIARSLTLRGIEYALSRGAQAVWLHVREENSAAIDLYTSLDFTEKARRTTWVCDPADKSTLFLQAGITARASLPSGIHIGSRHGQDWISQLLWLEQLYPAAINWHLSLKSRLLQPGIIGWLQRLWHEALVQQWSARRGDQLLAVLTWQSMPYYADNLWLAAEPNTENEAVSALLLHARRHLVSSRPLSLDFPTGQATEAIQGAGFKIHQTLIWMTQNL